MSLSNVYMKGGRSGRGMRNIRLLMEYEGTRYAGFQRQANALSIQEVIEEALEKITGERISLIGSGRTDAGVHALGQVANFRTESKMPPEAFTPALNSLLPRDIRIKESALADDSFHSRFDAVAKRYRYVIHNSRIHSAFTRDLAYLVPYELDIDLMRSAGKHLIGEHDFKAFSASGSEVVNFTRVVRDFAIERCGEYITIDIEANGFLYNMVRIIVGTLIEIGKGRLKQETVEEMLRSGERSLGGPTAPPHGLYLLKVIY